MYWPTMPKFASGYVLRGSNRLASVVGMVEISFAMGFRAQK
jgi:hypothetical protein